MNDKNTNTKPERSSGNEVGCDGLLAEKNKYVHRDVVDTLCDLLSSHYNETLNGGEICPVFTSFIEGIKYEVNHLS